MECNYCRGNRGETYICSVKRAKEVFRETEVHLDFGYFSKYFSLRNAYYEYFYCRKNIKGKIVFATKHNLGRIDPIYSFYLQKEQECSEGLKKEFEEKYLPQLYALYKQYSGDDRLIAEYHFICVELYNGKLKLHDVIL